MSKPDISNKINILERKGYKYILDRDIFCNINDKKCFSLEFLEDNPIEVIESKLREPIKNNIIFYFNIEPSDNARAELENDIKKLYFK
jgi:hypothetical protein